jgi:hypothetical protein
VADAVIFLDFSLHAALIAQFDGRASASTSGGGLGLMLAKPSGFS